jgi:hypothetical protein
VLRRQRNFRLFVDSGSGDGPPDRWFGSLRAALRAFSTLDEWWKQHAWIIEYNDQQMVGGIPTVRNVVHLRYGELEDDATKSEAGT